LILGRGLRGTAGRWGPVRRGFRWVHATARILTNEPRLPGPAVRRKLAGLLGAVSRHRPATGKLAAATGHFLKVTASYWPGLFHCYDVADLPRTNNDLEHLFGSNRHRERRCTGRKAASPAMVLRGPVRLIAATATRLRPLTGPDLAPADVGAWRKLRAELDDRREGRRQRCRFRRDPAAYLQRLEEQLRQTTLPA
jgi:hypothetical protein